ncbi:PAS-domain containing protein [Mangrovicoccus sp. HB161399]|uniref:hybrid sensor histidine kinase/response regulator n=1 Tax=Mangrovicoccus sp. HB161399 TaxID=2720392 RepID=UPI001557D4FC|nr:PAS-domain containing protein [Mangrovicoccus sp. HB161399]
MTQELVNPEDSLERQRDKLLKIATVLMRRVEQGFSDQNAGYAHFQRAVMLEEQVRNRTRDLERTLDLLNQANSQLTDATIRAEKDRANLSNAIEAIQEGFALFDAEERLVLCNSRFCQHLPDIQARMEPGLQFNAYVDMVSESRHLVLPPDVSVREWRNQRKDKHREDYVVFNVRLIWDRWLQVSEQRTPDGFTVMIHTDITDIIRLERRERERMLDDQARLIRATLDHVNQGVCIFDADHHLIGWNQRLSSLLAIPAGRLSVGARFGRLLDMIGERVQFAGAANAETLRDWVARETERPALSFEIQRGQRIILDVFAEETPDRGFVISFTDVTSEREAIRAMVQANETLEQRVAERTLDLEHALADAERANSSKSRFVAAASHDLLQPLSAAKLFLSSLEEGGASPVQQRETLQRTRNALVSVETILASLLDISRLDAGLAAVDPAPVPLGLVLNTLADEFEPMARAKGLQLTIVACSATVTSDQIYLRRILQNLIANAVRYTPAGRILVGARRTGDALRVEVWDTGVGIAPEDQQSIFREFHRGSEAADLSEGVGLGLAIVERACALLGHTVALSSEPGRGSVFSVTFARAAPAAHVARARTDPARAASSALEGQIALIVEADETLRAALAQQLDVWQMEVLDVPDAAEAAALLGEIDILPDLVILGIHRGEGVGQLDGLRAAAPQLGTLPTLVIASDKSLELRQKMERRGVEVARKPIDPDALHRRIDALLRPAISLTG